MASPGYWSDIREERHEKQQQESKPVVEVGSTSQAAVSESDDVSLMLDIKRFSERFSDDDSDGSEYSSVHSNDECSEASSVNSSSPLLRREPHAAGFKSLHSESSEPSSLDSVARQDKLLEGMEGEPMSPFSFQPSPQHHLPPTFSPGKLAGNEDDLPDWLCGRTTLSPIASTTKPSLRSPQQIEDEIRVAVDSAAARVHQELCRRQQFNSELQSAAMHSPTQGTAENQSATAKLFSSGKADTIEDVHAEDIPRDRTDNEMQRISEPETIMNEGEQGDLLLVMEVVIGDGRTETIEIHEGDNPDAVASTFALKHSLQLDSVPKLRGLIQDQLDSLIEAEPEELIQAEQPLADDWITDAEFDQLLNVTSAPVTAEVSHHHIDSEYPPYIDQPELGNGPRQTHERENHREFNYNNLMARYGHYSQHSGKVDPERRSLSGDTPAQATEYTRSNERSSTAPAFTTKANSSRCNSSKKKPNLADAPAYERLHALAESKDKWIQRAQKAKALEQARDEKRMHRVDVMAAKSRELVANRTNGGYAHIGERLHDEALSDMAKKVQRHERRAVEREQQQDWMCPKCAYVNQHSDVRCQNIVAVAQQKSKARHPASPNSGRGETSSSFGFMEYRPEVLCGQSKPERLFQPTLLTASAGVMKSVTANKEKSTRVASMRRQRHKNAIEAEFQQICPFKPKINNVSEEIVREKQETAAAAAALHGETRRPRNPHHELYENSFQARALRNEREEDYFRQFPFKPDIGVNALWVAPDKSQSDFVERLAVDKYHELERKRVALHDKYAPDRDPQTGKELFKPEIGRAPAFSRNKQGLPIGDFLHAAHREQQDYHRWLRERDQQEIKRKSQQTFVSEASRNALEVRKADTCSRIFNVLLALSRQQTETTADEGETQKELVTPARVDIATLPKEISRVVAIVFEYANHAPISQEAFSKYMDRLVHEVPDITYSHIIFLAEHLKTGDGHRHQQHHSNPEKEALAAAEVKELTFHPVIDKNSREIAMKHGRVSGSKVFSALNQYYDHYLERKEQLRKQQQREWKKSHPFQPTLVTKATKREPAAAAFYDKIRTGNGEDSRNAVTWGATASLSSAPLSQRNVDVAVPPPAPLQTALANARPCVRPIEAERNRFYTAATIEEISMDGTPGNISRSSSSSQLEDAELTSRVLAALDEKPASPVQTAYLAKTLSNSSLSGGKVCSVRSPEDSTLNGT
ncbi:hypothetical protein P3T76_000316 [Phytophthora citrophthora]|uniref:Uncharacterized protein n=1 Tax=Phytophthora citrophthora TaxID=4793 RepID=A0AAD9H0M1_9STRA|nr:hypothetical protein P3T76_000316 [Phytophthora citrophthora]